MNFQDCDSQASQLGLAAREGMTMSRKISRRIFTRGALIAGGLTLIARRSAAAEFELRQFHNQPADSPLHKRLVEMWAAVKEETGGDRKSVV